MSALRVAVTGRVVALPATFASLTLVVVEVSSETGSVRASEVRVNASSRGRERRCFMAKGWLGDRQRTPKPDRWLCAMRNEYKARISILDARRQAQCEGRRGVFFTRSLGARYVRRLR